MKKKGNGLKTEEGSAFDSYLQCQQLQLLPPSSYPHIIVLTLCESAVLCAAQYKPKCRITKREKKGDNFYTISLSYPYCFVLHTNNASYCL